ncbi:MAG: serine/threonine-protein kinase [Anaerolineae bacterium]
MFKVGAVLEDRYRLQSEGMAHDLGIVYRAYDLMADCLVDLLLLPEMAAADVEIVAPLREVQQRVTALGEAGLAPYENAGWTGGHRYLVRRHVEGHTLAELLAHHGRLEVRRAVEITIALCRVLAPAHRAGLVHGSLSPDCLFVRETAGGGAGLEVTVTDVGLVPALRPAMGSPARPWGRSPYLSPEQAAGEKIQPSSDVYVIGSLLYAMLTGRPPFRTRDETVLALQHLRQEPPALQILVPDLPVPLAQIVHSALAKEPAARYRNAGQLAHILSGQLAARRAPEIPRPAEPQAAAAAWARPSTQERLVVPPPPPRPVERAYEFVEDDAWDDAWEGVDWLLIGLLVLATIAVLGLIPLWRAVYQRYAVPPPLPTLEGSSRVGSEKYPLWLDAGVTLLEERSACETKLPGGAFLWYNYVLAGSSPNGTRFCQRSPVWESSLRVFTGNCCIIGREQVVEA